MPLDTTSYDQANTAFGNEEVDLNKKSYKYEKKVIDTKLWYLMIEEDIYSGELKAGTKITGQFTPTNVRLNFGANIIEGGGFGRTNPIIQWVGGTLDEISFQARLFSDTKDDTSAEEKFELLQLLLKAHQPLGRPPLTRFFWGNAINGGMLCFVSQLNAELDEIREDGSQKGMTIDITLKKFTQYTVDRTAAAPMERTPIHNVRANETYEMIALRRYGNALLGVSLRQQNPRFPMKKWAPKGYADLAAGETIKLYPKNDLIRVRPESHILSDEDQISLDNKRYVFTLRSHKRGLIPRK